MKNEYEKELESIYNQYGRRINKVEEPQNPTTSWNYLLRQVEEVGKDFMTERDERIKLRRKLSKYSFSFYNRIEQIKEQKIKEQEKQMRRQPLELMKIVKRKFWGSAMKVRKIVVQQEQKKVDK